MRAEARMRAEGIGNLRQRLAEMGGDQLLVRDVVGHFAQPVHIVGKGDEPRLDLVVGQNAEGVAHHGRARDFAECADMRQAGGAVAGFEQITSFWPVRATRATILRASSKGHAPAWLAASRSVKAAAADGSEAVIFSSGLCAAAPSRRAPTPYYQTQVRQLGCDERGPDTATSGGQVRQFVSTLSPPIQPRIRHDKLACLSRFLDRSPGL